MPTDSPLTLPAFSTEEREELHALLGSLVASMMGRKLEEGDWTDVYCKAKGIPAQGWSNVDIDVIHGNLGVEHKMLCRRSSVNLLDDCGKSLMHPAATRAIRVPSTDTDPRSAMVDILTQYGELIEARREKVERQNPSEVAPDIRTGWLLWQESLRQFLYFEEQMLPPDPDNYEAVWNTRSSAGGRKASTNLWVYEKDTGKKRFSVTTEAGAKIQPYFDVPPPNDPNLYLFTVIGEVVEVGIVRLWVAEATVRELSELIGGLDVENISQVVSEAAAVISEMGDSHMLSTPHRAQPIFMTEDAYTALREALPSVSDEHSLQMLARYLRSRS